MKIEVVVDVINNGLPIVYLAGLPAFSILPDGQRDPILPDGCTIYAENKQEVDDCLKTLTERLIKLRENSNPYF